MFVINYPIYFNFQLLKTAVYSYYFDI